MKKETINIPATIKTVFITDDGKKFEKEEEALQYEKNTEKYNTFKKRYNHTIINFENKKCDVLFLKQVNQEIKDELQKHYQNLIDDSLEVGWNLFIPDESGDSIYYIGFNIEKRIKEKSVELEELKKTLNACYDYGQ